MTAHTENHAHGTNDQIRTISRTTKTAYHPILRMIIRSGGTMVKKDWTFNKTIKTKKKSKKQKKIKNQKNQKTGYTPCT